jgi:hypothetical protein
MRSQADLSLPAQSGFLDPNRVSQLAALRRKTYNSTVAGRFVDQPGLDMDSDAEMTAAVNKTRDKCGIILGEGSMRSVGGGKVKLTLDLTELGLQQAREVMLHRQDEKSHLLPTEHKGDYPEMRDGNWLLGGGRFRDIKSLIDHLNRPLFAKVAVVFLAIRDGNAFNHSSPVIWCTSYRISAIKRTEARSLPAHPHAAGSCMLQCTCCDTRWRRGSLAQPAPQPG